MTTDLKNVRQVHFVGIGGSGMSALAGLLLARGYRVSGSDRKLGVQAQRLLAQGADVHTGHSGANLGTADLVVVSSAIRPDNPEVVAAIQAGIPTIKRAELLGSIVNAGCGIAVAGTHGKTTTSAMIGHILTAAGVDPTILLGGIAVDLGSNTRPGGGDMVVAEADEYDASFLHIQPDIAVITNVNPEHLDYYGTEQRMREAFHRFAFGVRRTLVVWGDEPGLPALVRDAPARVVTYGLHDGEWRACAIEGGPQGTHFHVKHGADAWTQSLQIVGIHNVLNALAASAVAAEVGVSKETIGEALTSFRGVRRRMEKRGEAGGVLVLDDYAVHPVEIVATLEALRGHYGRPIRVVFQPHTYSRVRAFLDDFGRSFGAAEAVYVMDVYAARETDTLGVSGRDIAETASRHHSSATWVGSPSTAVQRVVAEARPGDIVLTMGAGDVEEIGPRILEGLSA